MHPLITFALTLAVSAPAAAERKFDPEARARVIAPFLDEEVVAVAHLDLTRLDAGALAPRLIADELPPRDFQRLNRQLQQLREHFTRAGGKEVYYVLSLADVSPAKATPGFVIIPLEEGADEKALARFAGMAFEVGAQLPDRKAIFGGSKEALKRLRTLKPTPRPELLKAFAAAGDTTVQVLLLPTADNRRVIEEIAPTLPPEVGGGSSKVLTRGVRWAALGVDAAPKMNVRLVIGSQGAEDARLLHKLLTRIIAAVGRRKEWQDVAQTLARLMPQVKGDRLALRLDDRELAAALRPLAKRLRGAAGRSRSAKRLTQIGMALHTYHDRHKGFPTAASYDRQGQPLLSWRVHLLPLLGEEKLYKQFKLDEPWDSPHNRKLIPHIPAVYSPDDGKLTAAGKTLFLAPLGEATMFPGRKRVRISDVLDGTSNTIFIVEAADDQAVIWTKPADLKYDPKKPLAGLVDKHRPEFAVLLVDGTVHFLPVTISPETLRALFTRAGNEVVGDIP
jgi:hypothetical protein